MSSSSNETTPALQQATENDTNEADPQYIPIPAQNNHPDHRDEGVATLWSQTAASKASSSYLTTTDGSSCSSCSTKPSVRGRGNTTYPLAGYPDPPENVRRYDFPKPPARGEPLLETDQICNNYPRAYMRPCQCHQCQTELKNYFEVKIAHISTLGVGDLLERFAEETAQLDKWLGEEAEALKKLDEQIALIRHEMIPLKKARLNSDKTVAATKPKPLSAAERKKFFALQYDLAETNGIANVYRALLEGTIAGYLGVHRAEKIHHSMVEQVDILRRTWVVHPQQPGEWPQAASDIPVAMAYPRKPQRQMPFQISEINSYYSMRAKETYEEAYHCQWAKQRNRCPRSFFPSHKDINPSSSMQNNFVPEWFETFVGYNLVTFTCSALGDRFTELLNLISKLESEQQIKPATWDKQWHDPDPNWSTEARKRGGG